MPVSAQTTQPTGSTEWPEGVIARYLTVAGVSLGREDLAVEISHLHSDTRSKCLGCGQHKDHTTENYYIGSSREPVYFQDRDMGDRNARDWAQAHAEKCRAMPRPTA